MGNEQEGATDGLRESAGQTSMQERPQEKGTGRDDCGNLRKLQQSHWEILKPKSTKKQIGVS